MGKDYRKKKAPKGCRIKIEGRRPTSQLRRMLHDAVDHLEAKGIKEVTNCNLYVSLIPSQISDDLEIITIEDPHDCAADEYIP